MNLYFLVEGETERKVYEKWVQYQFPHLKLVERIKDIQSNSYYIVSGGGIPAIIDRIENAFKEIKYHGIFDHFLICLDSEQLPYAVSFRRIADKILEIQNKIDKKHSFKTHIIMQHCCIETWFLGHQKMLRRNLTNSELIKYKKFYDVSQFDPELMEYPPGYLTKASFHLRYLQEMLKEHNMDNKNRQMIYTKNNPFIVIKDAHYLNALKERCETTTHLSSLKYLLDIWHDFGHKV
ncbi:hypothetical protein PN36_06515 [Candidatus Thiomargarita nelsonii]|uniref:DUF4276 family protein n=1 Tax=Candidatus Thiomargarita nelsonii TaxID=1003181 RepID=A0A0A6P8Q7_9GAMM|nr:hypothetical protein PN36_06515 [Candidatus Thiomargarita nelsonii]